MIAIRPFYHLPVWLVAFLDSFLLILVLSPVLYWFLFLPLVRQLNESERTQRDLHESELRMRTVFRTSPDSISISRLKDGALVDVNEGFCELSGYARNEVIGKSSLTIPLWVDDQERGVMIARLVKKGRVRNFESRFQIKDGSILDVLISARVIMLKEEQHILAITREISDLKRTEKSLRESRNFLRISNRNRKMDGLLLEFVSEVRRLSGCSAIGIRLLDGDGNIPYQAYEGFTHEFHESENSRTFGYARCMCTDVTMGKAEAPGPFTSAGGSFYISSTTDFIGSLTESQKDRLCSVCSKYGYESMALVPIRLQEKVLGLIHVADPRKEALPEGTIEILEEAALQLATAIKRMIAEEGLRKSHLELERRIAERTDQLIQANEMLSAEIKERRAKEEKLVEQQKKMSSLSSELLLTQERERRRIATELHDRIGQALAVSRIKLGNMREDLATNEPAAAALEEVRQYIEQTIEDTRSLTFELSPPVLYELGLVAALTWLADRIRSKHGLRVEIKDDGKAKPLADNCRVIAFQTVRELLFNVIKHVRARSAIISIQRNGGVLHVDIQDDGIGFNTSGLDPMTGGFGLFSIRERLKLLNGSLLIKSEPGSGTQASISMPLSCTPQDGED